MTAAQAARIAILEEQLRLAAVKAFAPKSEKLALAQMDLFYEAEALTGADAQWASEAPEADEITVPAYARDQRMKRVYTPFHLPYSSGRNRQGAPERKIHSTASTNSRRKLVARRVKIAP